MDNSGTPIQFGSASAEPGVASDAPIIINNGSRGGSKKKFIIIGVIVAVLAAVGVVIALLAFSGKLSGGLERDKAMTALRDISKNASDLEYLLDKIYNGEISMAETRSDDLGRMLSMYNSVKKQYESVSKVSRVSGASADTSKAFANAIIKTKEWVDAYSSDMQMLADFNDGFIKKLTEVRDVPVPEDKLNSEKLMAWEHNAQARKLLSSNDNGVKAVAEQLDAYIKSRVEIIAEYNRLGCEDAKEVAPSCLDIRVSLSVSHGDDSIGADVLMGMVSSFRGKYSDKQTDARALSELAFDASIDIEEGEK
ncbi:MAG: hypothetical protein LBH36_02285 [Candidatus Nomurabacteria bacterium]|jgi:hypothetical protein|nr:hypothetical protein [Candidatus Nomurabacteria bacterium]